MPTILTAVKYTVRRIAKLFLTYSASREAYTVGGAAGVLSIVTNVSPLVHNAYRQTGVIVEPSDIHTPDTNRLKSSVAQGNPFPHGKEVTTQ